MNRNEQWQLEADAAELYERYVARFILGPWAPGLVDLAAVQPGARVLDLACGTGVVARVAAERVGTSGCVVGLDLNAGMLAVARALPAPPGAAVTWIERSALDTGLPENSFDVVLCQQGLQFFPDKIVALREMHRVLVPGGRIALSVWRTAGLYNSALGRALSRHVGSETASRFCASRRVPDERALVDSALASGFLDVKLHVQTMMVRLPPPEEFVLGHLGATPVASEVRALSEPDRKALAEDVARELSGYREADGLAFPEETNVIAAHT